MFSSNNGVHSGLASTSTTEVLKAGGVILGFACTGRMHGWGNTSMTRGRRSWGCREDDEYLIIFHCRFWKVDLPWHRVQSSCEVVARTLPLVSFFLLLRVFLQLSEPHPSPVYPAKHLSASGERSASPSYSTKRRSASKERWASTGNS